MRSLMITAAAAVTVLATPASAQTSGYGSPYGGPPPGNYNRPLASRPYVDIPYAQRDGSVPYRFRGFEDPGYAYHGNVNGCAEDLGYGRWAPCR